MYNLSFYKKEGIFDKFFDQRSSLIVQFSDGVISKRQFLEYNFELVRKTNLKPFLKIDSYEKGMFNYQYYNVLAKYYNMLAKETKNTRRHKRYYNYYFNKGNNYYHEKDKAALSLLEFLNFEGVEAYYIKVNSDFLRNKLYEIVLLEYKEAIFHSKASWLLEVLRKKNIFIENKRESLIDGYINEPY